ncbi:hypothetical protein COLO4_04257 [Corchorus olitorius]|uniref:Uncharacterized protein n=1 Tax=Corchorus olitorius TaxID=93759 RepID=A0A1R3KUS8_9ROSI|nr:hypothetical protein COLO4_04257 [Corchorus olitorius]
MDFKLSDLKIGPSDGSDFQLLLILKKKMKKKKPFC